MPLTTKSKKEILQTVEEKAYSVVDADNPFETAEMIGYIEALKDNGIITSGEAHTITEVLLLDLMMYAIKE